MKKKYKIGFIGTGFMGEPILRGMAREKNTVCDMKSMLNIADDIEDILIFDINYEKARALSEELGVCAAASNRELTEKCNVIMLCVKPDMVNIVLEEIKDLFSNDKLLITIAAGIPIKAYKNILGDDAKVIRTMPNRPALINEGVTVYAYDECVSDEDTKFAEKIFSKVGMVEFLPEKLMNAAIGLMSSSPAYVFMFIEAMADAAVKDGIPREMAYRLAAGAVQGSAKMVNETNTHPAVLKDAVCSPGGTTIEALKVLENKGFRSAVMEAMGECTRKANILGEKFGQ